MWLESGNTFFTRDPGADVGKLPPCVYTVEANPRELFLQKQQDRFEFPYKLYNTDNFPERVAHTFHHTTGNLGILLTGLKGTGKTVQAEQICNLIELPTLLITSNFEGGLVPFLNKIQEDIIVFIDEYEKIFERSNALLSLMDGALRTKYRRIFILTTNETYISEAMLNRPSRILYTKQFGNLDGPVIAEIVNDMVEDPMARREAIKFMGSLEIITVDIVKAICAEMIRFGEIPPQFASIMNIRQRRRSQKTVNQLIGGIEQLVGTDLRIGPSDPFDSMCVEDHDEFMVSPMEGGEWMRFGHITSADRNAGTVTTEQGVFKIEDSKVHPSLINMLTRSMAL